MSSGDSIHEKMEMHPSTGHMESLSRQITMQISPEQYEKLYYQPTAAKGDLAKRLGNPTLLGVCGFLIPFQTTVFCILGWRGAGVASLVEVSGAFYFLGGIAMVIAGICEFILGNSQFLLLSHATHSRHGSLTVSQGYPFAVFVIYGAHWCQVAYSFDPAHNLNGAYGTATTAPFSKPLNGGAAFYDITMMLISCIFFIGSLRTNVPFALAIFCLIPLFALFAAGQWQFAYGGATAANVAHAEYLFKVAGGFGLVTALAGWYVFLFTLCVVATTN